MTVCYFLASASNCTKIVNRMFCPVTENWLGRHLGRHMAMNFIAAVMTKGGLTIQSEFDRNRYATGQRVTGKHMKIDSIKRVAFRGQWNSTLVLRSQDDETVESGGLV